MKTLLDMDAEQLRSDDDLVDRLQGEPEHSGGLCKREQTQRYTGEEAHNEH